MNVREFHYERVEQYYADAPETEFSLLQLTPGALNFRSVRVDLDGVILEWNRTGARFRSREVNHGQGLQFGFVLDTPTRLMLGGQPLDYDWAAMWHPGREVDYITPAGLASLIVVVDEKLLNQLGWVPSYCIAQKVPGKRLHALKNACRLATQAAQTRDAENHTPATLEIWRKRVLVALESALDPWLRPAVLPQSRKIHRAHRWLVKDADRWFEQQDPGHTITVDDCVAAIGVSRRTLFRAFREELGMGPQGYLQLVRLHQLRERLLAASPTRTLITNLAGELGFTHMGRLSAAYRNHFGEYPKETLRRS